ncbi:uncharacterized protein FPRO_02343 [Fusarium proliferatum ET1]|uniref:Uncharacterized protein n=1 Tax=Fusarium proliferatum (strain ET1) TaxID=1227346 RepID=A0A1L7V9D1_FUSPR|nr:uncharacterized protein FPRO_02343 [Fusarium proliferatum ET1]CZR37397.1 uncharacterized protein FPRO_02343 [Fusarium proliferatum ET1]
MSIQRIDIKIGNAGESYIYIDPRVGHEIRSAIVRSTAPNLLHDYEPIHFNLITNPSTFHIVSIVKNLLFLRVGIPQNLGHSSNGVSPATLWLSGHMYPITLNGSPDEAFERMSTETGAKLKGALDKLKDN